MVLTSVVHAVGIELSTRMVTLLRRAKVKFNRLLDNLPPKAHPAPESTCRVPYEIVEMVIAHLTHDLDTLKACSLTCRSWRIAATPHLHHTLALTGERPEPDRSRLEPLPKLYELGLIPLVREIRVRQGSGSGSWFVPQAVNHLELRYFSAFANVHTLNLQYLQIHRFISDTEHYFGNFFSTLQSIILSDPCCTRRQLSYFLSFFQNLDNVDIRNPYTRTTDTTVPDVGLVPSSAQRLRGRLALHYFPWAETWTDFIASYGGVRFCRMILCGSGNCAPPLLEACAETLETLRFDAWNTSVGKQFLCVGLSMRLS